MGGGDDLEDNVYVSGEENEEQEEEQDFEFQTVGEVGSDHGSGSGEDGEDGAEEENDDEEQESDYDLDGVRRRISFGSTASTPGSKRSEKDLDDDSANESKDKEPEERKEKKKKKKKKLTAEAKAKQDEKLKVLVKRKRELNEQDLKRQKTTESAAKSDAAGAQSLFWSKFVELRKKQMQPLEKKFPLADHHFAVVEGVEDRSAENINRFVRRMAPSLESKTVEPKAPGVVVITPSAIRATELIRNLRSFAAKGAPVGKLFAKHMKIDDQVKVLSVAKMKIVVGTPHRLLNLSDMEALSLAGCSHIVVDIEPDKKNQTLFTMKEILADFMAWYHQHCHSRVVDGAMKIALY